MEEQTSYDIVELREGMLKHLNGAAESYPQCIEKKFPHVLAMMVKLWGTTAMDAYLTSLMVTNRPNRVGFPADAATEIFRLSLLHGALEVTKSAKTTGWSSVSDGEISKLFEKKTG